MTIEQSVLDKIHKERGVAYDGATATPYDPDDPAAGEGALWVITHPAQHPLYAVVSGLQIFIMASANSARALLYHLNLRENGKPPLEADLPLGLSPVWQRNSSHVKGAHARSGRH